MSSSKLLECINDWFSEPSNQSYSNNVIVDKVTGWSGNHINPDNNKNETEESCRLKALQDPNKFAAWGYRKSNHPDSNWKNTCFLYTKPFQPFGGANDDVHVTGCLNPGEKVALGCKPL